MAIAPISSTMVQKNSIINFQGKKNNASKSQPVITSPMVKAVPLAVLIAMSPINSPAANNLSDPADAHRIEYVENPDNSVFDTGTQSSKKYSIIDAKKFFERDKTGTAEGLPVYGEFQLINNDKNSDNFESIRLRLTRDYFDEIADDPYEGPVKGFSRINLTIVGDDGVPVSKAAFDQIVIRDEATGYDIPVSRPEMCAYMDSLLKSENNNTNIKKTVINRTVRPSAGGGLQNLAAPTDWYEKAKLNDEYFGTELMSADVNGTFGKYKLRAYNMDNNKDNFERITIQKEGGPELIVDAIKLMYDKIFNYGFIGNIIYHQLDVSRRNLGVHSIIDPNLYNSLKDVVNHPKFNNAYEVKEVEELTLIDENAVVSDVD